MDTSVTRIIGDFDDFKMVFDEVFETDEADEHIVKEYTFTAKYDEVKSSRHKLYITGATYEGYHDIMIGVDALISLIEFDLDVPEGMLSQLKNVLIDKKFTAGHVSSNDVICLFNGTHVVLICTHPFDTFQPSKD